MCDREMSRLVPVLVESKRGRLALGVLETRLIDRSIELRLTFHPSSSLRQPVSRVELESEAL